MNSLYDEYKMMQHRYDNHDNPGYQEEKEDLDETTIEGIEKEIRTEPDRLAVAFMSYMCHANTEEIPMNVAEALWQLAQDGLPFRRSHDRTKPLNIVVNAATRWKAEQEFKNDLQNK